MRHWDVTPYTERNSAHSTAQLIGCNYKKAEKIQRIRKDGTPEIQRAGAVRTDKMRIHSADNRIREMQKANDSGNRDSRASGGKAPKIVISEEIFARLNELEGDPEDHVNKAIGVYLRWLKENDDAQQPFSV